MGGYTSVLLPFLDLLLLTRRFELRDGDAGLKRYERNLSRRRPEVYRQSSTYGRPHETQRPLACSLLKRLYRVMEEIFPPNVLCLEFSLQILV